MLASIPPLFGWGTFRFSYGQAICTNHWPASVSYFVVVMFGAVFIPFGIITFAYVNIVRTVLKSRRRILSHTGRSNNTGRTVLGVHRADIQLSKMSFVVCMTFVACWSPISVLNSVIILGSGVSIDMEMLATCSMYVNTLIDPLIYAFMNGPFRREFQNIFKRSPNQQEQTTQ